MKLIHLIIVALMSWWYNGIISFKICLIFIGLFLGYGSNKLNNIKLSISGKLSVLVINSFGIYTRVNITVQVNVLVVYIFKYNIYFQTKEK